MTDEHEINKIKECHGRCVTERIGLMDKNEWGTGKCLGGEE